MNAELITQKFKSFIEHPKSIQVITLTLVVLLAWILGQLLMQSLHVADAPSFDRKMIQKLEQQVARGTPSLIFGEPDEVKVEKPKVDVTEIKKSRLNVTLVGVIDLGNKGVAILKKGNKDILVAEGEEIQRGVQLIDILPTQVIIDNQGKREKLELIDIAKQVLVQDASPASRRATTPPSESSLSNRQKRQVSGIMNDLKKKPSQIAKFIRFEPLFENGRIEQIKIWPKSDKALFKSLGLEAGDSLISINGSSVDHISRQPKILQRVLKSEQFDMVVMRDGGEIALSINLN